MGIRSVMMASKITTGQRVFHVVVIELTVHSLHDLVVPPVVVSDILSRRS